MPSLIAIHQLEPQPFVSVREQCTQRELPSFLQHSFGELSRCLGVLGVAPSGHPFVLYHAFGPDGVDAEVALPVRAHVVGTGIVESGVLPAMTVARAVHVGTYGDIGRSYAALSTWIKDHGYETSGLVLERYLLGPGDGVPASEFRTELEMALVPEVVVAPV